jgi:hypothetical protein
MLGKMQAKSDVWPRGFVVRDTTLFFASFSEVSSAL